MKASFFVAKHEDWALALAATCETFSLRPSKLMGFSPENFGSLLFDVKMANLLLSKRNEAIEEEKEKIEEKKRLQAPPQTTEELVHRRNAWFREEREKRKL